MELVDAQDHTNVMCELLCRWEHFDVAALMQQEMGEKFELWAEHELALAKSQPKRSTIPRF